MPAEAVGNRYLVYVMVVGQPWPQLWYGDVKDRKEAYQYKPVGAEGSTLLYFRKLEGDDLGLSFDQLIEKYPFVPNLVFTGG